VEEIGNQIDFIAEQLKESTRDALGTEIQKCNRSYAFATVSQKASERIESVWKSSHGRWSIIPGKEAFARLSCWSKSSFNVSFSAVNIAREILPEEIDSEIVEVLTCIEMDRAFVCRELGD